MDKIRLLLTVITIAIIAVPLLGTLLANQGNLLGLIIPPEANEIIDTLSSGGGSEGPQMEPVGEPQYDPASRTFTQTIQFTNTFPFDITINSMSGDVQCAADGFPLGTLTLDEPVSIPKGETRTLTVLGTWTQGAINHFQSKHADEATVLANLVGFTVDVKGIQVQMNQTMEVPNPTYTG